jgi:acyl-CoA reductase-like NAD-dependent aldehyde dehydrogenase
MCTKKITRILAIILVSILALSVYSCTAAESVIRDVPRIAEFTSEIAEIAKLTDPKEIETRATDLIHPKANLTLEKILEKAQADEALQGIDIQKEVEKGYSIGNFSDPQLKLNDPDLGGNIYEITVNVTVGDYTFKVIVDLLSDETDLGLYDFDITR